MPINTIVCKWQGNKVKSEIYDENGNKTELVNILSNLILRVDAEAPKMEVSIVTKSKADGEPKVIVSVRPMELQISLPDKIVDQIILGAG